MTKKVTVLPDTAENRELTDNVHPTGWVNPQPAGRYNLVIVGAGTAGLVCAAGAAGLGARVALVERHLMGGDCLNMGCVPSKTLLRSGRAAYDAMDAGRFGVRGISAECDFAAVMARMRRVRANLSSHDSAARFRELGVDVFLGSGRFVAHDSVEVAGQRLLFAKAVICTGAHAAVPQVPGLADAGYFTNETVFSLTTLPKRLAVIGAGAIGCELAQAFARFGSRVTIIEQGKQLLGKEDPDAADIVHEAFIREGIELRLGATMTRVERHDDERVVHLERGGERLEVKADAILIGIGRAPNLAGLDLEAAGVAWDKGGVRVSDTLQTSNPRIFSAGDICSPLKFTNTADAQARIVIANALFKGRRRTSSLTIPWCTYTDPEIAHVGLYESEAVRAGLAVTTLTVPLSQVDRAHLDGETEGFARVHLRRGSDTILGATIVARHAGEMIGELSLAITNGLGLKAVAKTLRPYPTQEEVVSKLADAYQRSRLTPFVKSVLARWLKWQRS